MMDSGCCGNDDELSQFGQSVQPEVSTLNNKYLAVQTNLGKPDVQQDIHFMFI